MLGIKSDGSNNVDTFNRQITRARLLPRRRQRLGKDVAEVAGLRERGRELAREVKRLTQEGDARQKRLEEARERSATAEEAFRASQV